MDIVEKLRKAGRVHDEGVTRLIGPDGKVSEQKWQIVEKDPLLSEAADEIERLRAEIERLRHSEGLRIAMNPADRRGPW